MEQRKLYRSSERMIGGVAGGLAEYLGVDPLLVRIAFVVLALVNGFGLLVYLVMWAVVPDRESSGLEGEDVLRANLNDIGQQARKLGGSMDSSKGAALVGVVLVVAGVLFLAQTLIPNLPPGLVWPIALILLGIFLVARR